MFDMSMSSCCVRAVRRRLTTHAREGHSRCRCRANDFASAGVVWGRGGVIDKLNGGVRGGHFSGGSHTGAVAQCGQMKQVLRHLLRCIFGQREVCVPRPSWLKKTLSMGCSSRRSSTFGRRANAHGFTLALRLEQFVRCLKRRAEGFQGKSENEDYQK